MRIAFTIPGCPVPWERTGHRPSGATHSRFFTPSATRKYQEWTRSCALRAGCPVFRSPVAMELHIYFPDNQVRDDDNVEKSIRDALQGKRRKRSREWALPPTAWENDHHVKRVLRIVEDPDPQRPRCEVILTGSVLEQQLDLHSDPTMAAIQRGLAR